MPTKSKAYGIDRRAARSRKVCPARVLLGPTCAQDARMLRWETLSSEPSRRAGRSRAPHASKTCLLPSCGLHLAESLAPLLGVSRRALRSCSCSCSGSGSIQRGFRHDERAGARARARARIDESHAFPKIPGHARLALPPRHECIQPTPPGLASRSPHARRPPASLRAERQQSRGAPPSVLSSDHK